MANKPRVSLDKISAGDAIVASRRNPGDEDRAEEAALEETKREAEVDSIKQANLDRVENRNMRKQYASKVFCYLSFYTIGAAVLTVATGLECTGFKLPEIVLTTIVGSTAVAAIGLVGFVVNGLFKNSK